MLPRLKAEHIAFYVAVIVAFETLFILIDQSPEFAHGSRGLSACKCFMIALLAAAIGGAVAYLGAAMITA